MNRHCTINSEKVLMMYSKKIKAKCLKDDIAKRFFGSLAGWHLATSL